MLLQTSEFGGALFELLFKLTQARTLLVEFGELGGGEALLVGVVLLELEELLAQHLLVLGLLVELLLEQHIGADQLSYERLAVDNAGRATRGRVLAHLLLELARVLLVDELDALVLAQARLHLVHALVARLRRQLQLVVAPLFNSLGHI